VVPSFFPKPFKRSGNDEKARFFGDSSDWKMVSYLRKALSTNFASHSLDLHFAKTKFLFSRASESGQSGKHLFKRASLPQRLQIHSVQNLLILATNRAVHSALREIYAHSPSGCPLAR